MSAPRLVKVAGSAFGSLLEPFELELPETGLMLLRGRNADTGGSSGSGKSTLIQAINYPFGTCDVPLTELQNWDSEEAPQVVDTYRVNGKLVDIARGKKFYVREAGELVKGGAKQKEEAIDRIFGMDAEMRALLTYRGQRKPGLFLSKADTAKKEFLTKLLGLDKFEQQVDAANERAKALGEKLVVLNASANDLRMQLEALGPQEDLDKLRRETAQASAEARGIEAQLIDHIAWRKQLEQEGEAAYATTLLTFKQQVDEVQRRLTILQSIVAPVLQSNPALDKAKQVEAELKRRYDKLCDDDKLARAGRDRTVADLSIKLSGQRQKARGADRLEARLNQVCEQILELKKQTCPTCKREWDQADQFMKDLQAERATLDHQWTEALQAQNAAELLQKQLDELPPHQVNPMVEKMLTAWRKASDAVAAENQKVAVERATSTAARDKAIAETKAELAAVKAGAQAKAEAARAEKRAEIARGQEAADDLHRRQAIVAQGLQELQGRLSTMTERQRLRDDLTARGEKLAEEAARLGAEQARELDFAALVGREGFLGSIFDEVLAEISDETNQVLASIANTRHCTLHFTSENLTKKGTLNREIVPVITINGHKASLKFGPSGGMTSAIELAVDLAVGAVISRRTGVVPGWLILDEPFDGLGVVEKETCLEILQKYAQERLVIVVDHASETQGLFTKRVTVEFVDGRSRIC